MKTCITIDMDNYQDYQRLVDADGAADDHSFYRNAVPRFLDLLDEAGARATFFLVGRDGAVAANRPIVRSIADRGHEIGNHSQTHPYDFRNLTREQKVAEIAQCEATIADITGVRPVGFRTPSFDVDLETLRILAERDYLYDSSVMPSPLMWVFMLYGKLFIRSVSYQLGEPAAVLAPTSPYYPSGDRLHRRARAGDSDAPGVLEIPGSVLAGLRIPFYATVLRLLGGRALDLLIRAYGRRPAVLHSLFHLLDVEDLAGTDLHRALSRTPGIGVSVERRRAFVVHALASFTAAAEPVTLAEFARGFVDAAGAAGAS